MCRNRKLDREFEALARLEISPRKVVEDSKIHQLISDHYQNVFWARDECFISPEPYIARPRITDSMATMVVIAVSEMVRAFKHTHRNMFSSERASPAVPSGVSDRSLSPNNGEHFVCRLVTDANAHIPIAVSDDGGNHVGPGVGETDEPQSSPLFRTRTLHPLYSSNSSLQQ